MPSRDFFCGSREFAGNLQGILLMSMIGDGKGGPMDWFAERPLDIEGEYIDKPIRSFDGNQRKLRYGIP